MHKVYLLCSQYLVFLGLAWVERGMDALYIYKVCLVYRELCHLVQYTCPIVLLLIIGL